VQINFEAKVMMEVPFNGGYTLVDVGDVVAVQQWATEPLEATLVLRHEGQIGVQLKDLDGHKDAASWVAARMRELVAKSISPVSASAESWGKKGGGQLAFSFDQGGPRVDTLTQAANEAARARVAREAQRYQS
jgi:hypothetical protein